MVKLQFEELPYEDRSFKDFYDGIRSASTLEEAINTGREVGDDNYKSEKQIISFLASQIANKRHPCVYILDDDNRVLPYEQIEADDEADEDSNRNDPIINAVDDQGTAIDDSAGDSQFEDIENENELEVKIIYFLSNGTNFELEFGSETPRVQNKENDKAYYAYLRTTFASADYRATMPQIIEATESWQARRSLFTGGTIVGLIRMKIKNWIQPTRAPDILIRLDDTVYDSWTATQAVIHQQRERFLPVDWNAPGRDSPSRSQKRMGQPSPSIDKRQRR